MMFALLFSHLAFASPPQDCAFHSQKSYANRSLCLMDGQKQADNVDKNPVITPMDDIVYWGTRPLMYYAYQWKCKNSIVDDAQIACEKFITKREEEHRRQGKASQ